MPKKPSNRSQQPSTSRARTQLSSDDEFDQEISFSSMPSNNIETVSNNLVKYLLNYSATKNPIKRSDIAKNVNIHPKIFADVLKSASYKLKDIYGMEISELPESRSGKMYILYSEFNSIVSSQQLTKQQQEMTTFLFIILSYIFMKGGEVHESHLFQYLEQLDINCNETHSEFGDISDLICKVFTKQQYLKRTKVEIEGVNDPVIHVSWGTRAEKEFNKAKILSAVAEIMKKSPISFTSQYHAVHGEEPQSCNSIVID
ncbi:CLUMA_CG003432, isoform A [Clunio marinus]|uniref:CLUMA_CG003432, isoform A n=1 Tax=Clunio marinus TaxID=568069 RepID=A0A1J1HU28_9DIPT|nr:CLUMA_CG003432, isoform A [Clunio marinus]